MNYLDRIHRYLNHPPIKLLLLVSVLIQSLSVDDDDSDSDDVLSEELLEDDDPVSPLRRITAVARDFFALNKQTSIDEQIPAIATPLIIAVIITASLRPSSVLALIFSHFT